MSNTEARNCSINMYAGLIPEIIWRNSDDDKNAPDPPPENFVLEQMRMLADRGVKVH